MKVLIIGSGGREDALAWKLNGEDSIDEVLVCPGNIGMKRLAKVELIEAMDFESLSQLARTRGVSLCICGPEAPLTQGISTLFENQDINFFGPSREAAQLEGSKIFSKEFMKEHSIPTAPFTVASDYESALEIIRAWGVEERGVVLKADGLAGGKGVVVTHSLKEAESCLYDFMKDESVSVKTDKILIEEVLRGVEVSCFALCSGEGFFFLGSACDHKRVGDGDTGPNTGGMGCYRDRSWPNTNLQKKVIEQVLKPTLKGMKEKSHPFTGFLFMGLMIDEFNEPSVIEYNVRMGDPETQTLMPLLEGMLGLSLKGLTQGAKETDLKLIDKDSVHVVMTSGGYPSIGKHSMSLGHKITFKDPQALQEMGELFFAGVKSQGIDITNSGGRVLGVTCVGDSIEECRKQVYSAIELVDFKDGHYRRDIGQSIRGEQA